MHGGAAHILSLGSHRGDCALGHCSLFLDPLRRKAIPRHFLSLSFFFLFNILQNSAPSSPFPPHENLPAGFLHPKTSTFNTAWAPLWLRSHDFAIGCHLAPPFRDQNECCFILVASALSMVSDNRVRPRMQELMRGSPDGTVEADPDRQRQNGVSGCRDLLWGRGVADHLVQTTPGSCPLLIGTSPCLVFHGISHCLLCYLLTCLSSVAPTLALLSCSMTAPMLHDLPLLTTYPQPWHSQRHTVGHSAAPHCVMNGWIPCPFEGLGFCSQGLVFCLSYKCPFKFQMHLFLKASCGIVITSRSFFFSLSFPYCLAVSIPQYLPSCTLFLTLGIQTWPGHGPDGDLWRRVSEETWARWARGDVLPRSEPYLPWLGTSQLRLLKLLGRLVKCKHCLHRGIQRGEI